jgi:acetyl esterase/lipase
MVIDLAARLDGTHRAVLDMLPVELLDLSDIGQARAVVAGLMEAMPAPPTPGGLTTEDVAVNDDMFVRVYRPADLPSPAPAFYWIHGGGMVLGDVSMDDASCAAQADTLKALVVSAEYRLAPEHPYPAPMDDCYAGLKWLADNAADLDIDPARIAIGGASAGGGLAAGLALLARDRGGPAICFQLLTYPMLDDRSTTASSHGNDDTRVWNRAANLTAWKAYLDGEPGSDGVEIYAAPARATDLSGLPPAFIPVGDLDNFHDEDVAYAQALQSAGVPVELHVYPGAFHGSNMLVADSPLSQRWQAEEMAALDAALNGN